MNMEIEQEVMTSLPSLRHAQTVTGNFPNKKLRAQTIHNTLIDLKSWKCTIPFLKLKIVLLQTHVHFKLNNKTHFYEYTNEYGPDAYYLYENGINAIVRESEGVQASTTSTGHTQPFPTAFLWSYLSRHKAEGTSH